MFGYCQIKINHTCIGRTNSQQYNYFLPQFFDDCINFDRQSLATQGSLEGIWSKLPYGSDSLPGSKELDLRVLDAQPIDDEPNKYRWTFIMRLNTILSTMHRPLPKDCIVDITLGRLAAKFSIITLETDLSSGKDTGRLKELHDKPLALIDPILKCNFYESSHYDHRLLPRKISKVPYPFVSKEFYEKDLDTGYTEFRDTISNGQFILLTKWANYNTYR